MNNYKKLFCVLFSSLVLFSMFFGCSKSHENEARFITGDYNSSNSNDVTKSKTDENDISKPVKTETNQSYPDSSLYDKILASGDGYFLVSKYEEDYDYASMQFGVINEKNIWLLSLSDNNVFGNAYKDVSGKKDLNGKVVSLSYEYIGKGVFICTEGVRIKYPDGTSKKVGKYTATGSGGLAVYCYNAEKNSEFVFNAVNITPYENGYMLMYASQRYNDPFYRVDTVGNVTELPVKYDSWNGYTDTFPAYSDGLFYANRYFYNISGDIVIDLTNFDLTNTDLHFNNEECELTFKNPGGTIYRAIIDKNGNFIKEPKPIE